MVTTITDLPAEMLGHVVWCGKLSVRDVAALRACNHHLYDMTPDMVWLTVEAIGEAQRVQITLNEEDDLMVLYSWASAALCFVRVVGGWVYEVAVCDEVVFAATHRSVELFGRHLRPKNIGTLAGESCVAVQGQMVASVSKDDASSVSVLEMQVDHFQANAIYTLEGHTNDVWAIVFNAAATRVFTGSWDDTIRVWSLPGGECVQTLAGHTGSVVGLALLPCETQLLSGSRDKTLKLWDLGSGECVQTLEAHADDVNCVAVSGGGRIALSGSSDNTLRLWDLRTFECVKVLEGHSKVVTSVGITKDALLCVSGSWDKTLRVWLLAGGRSRCVAVLQGHTNWVFSVAISSDNVVYSGSDDETLRAWDISALIRYNRMMWT